MTSHSETAQTAQQSDGADRGDQAANPIFPFCAIVGQERMKLALTVNAINPGIGGVLIRGEKGTAKSTAARSLAALLPRLDVVAGCPYSCAPDAPFSGCGFCAGADAQGRRRQAVQRQARLVELPVSATEEAVVGALDIEAALREGSRRFEPGLLAAAHRGILYIDEVNLLNDHVVDALLDSAAMGRNFVEREGISFAHPAQFLLIGTMNPEEGDLRPQFIDRFGLAVEIDHIRDAPLRAEVVRRRIAYESDPAAFRAAWADAEDAERRRIADAKALLPSVVLDDAMLTFIARLCAEHEVDGLRADIVIYKTAQTLAAYGGRASVVPDDVLAAAEMALLHRMRRQPFDDPELNRERLRQMGRELADAPPDDAPEPPPEPQNGNPPQSNAGDDATPQQQPDAGDSAAGADDEVFGAGEPYQVKPLNLAATDRRRRTSRGRRASSRVSDRRGRYVGAMPPEGKATDLAMDATLRAAAPHQLRRGARTDGNLALKVEPWDLRQKVRESRVGSLIVFVVDASGSMGAERRMTAAKGAVMSLLTDAYQRRERVAMIAFRGAGSELALPPTSSANLARERLANMPTGGRTPMARALADAHALVRRQRLRDPDAPPFIALVSDCAANVSMAGGDAFDEALAVCERLRQDKVHAAVLDPAPRANRFGLARQVADALGGMRIPLSELRSDSIRRAVRDSVGQMNTE